MPVIWLIQVQDAMQELLGTSGSEPGVFPALLDRIGGLLQATFPDAEAIVVVDRLDGYSRGAAKHVLRVQVIEQGISLARIVKIAPPPALAKEYSGWRRCERPANDRGRVFVHLRPGKLSDDGTGQIETLVYEDAEQTLRAAKLLSLELAVLQCCQFGIPAADSLLAVIDQIFAEMLDRLYRRSESRRAEPAACQALAARLAPGNGRWNAPADEPGQCRAAALAELLGSAPDFIDPVQLVHTALADPATVPEMRYGCSHGDLNGRNVLVGTVDGEALFPAVFDYEDMDTSNLVGWDFAKLETELKVRALQKVFPGNERAFIRSVWRFEEELARETERRNNENFEEWKDSRDHGTPEARLFAVLLAIRRQAKKCLEIAYGRSRRWLHEHYFLLAAYGVYAGRFEAYYRRDLIAGYVCAGHAAGRYAWGQTSLVKPERAAIDEARRALAEGRPAARLHVPQALHYAPEFAFALEFARSRQRDFVEAGVAIFGDLLTRHSSAVEIRQELALALCELFDLTGDVAHLGKSERVLSDLDGPSQHYETLCRWGRLWKDRGDRDFDASGEEAKARHSYRNALRNYEQAYAIDRHYYPGINVATLSLLLGAASAAEPLARDLLERLSPAPRDATLETVWRLATQAEAHLVLAEFADAAAFYTAAIKHSKCQPQHREAMHKQVQRLLRIHPSPEVDFDEVFGTGEPGV